MHPNPSSKGFAGFLRGALPLCLLASLALGVSAQEPQEEATSSQARAPLPSPACLKILREARILGLPGRHRDAELRKLLEAREAFPDEFVVSSALLGYHHRLPLPPETLQGLLAEIESRLKDEQNPISIGVLRQVIEDPETGESLLLALAEHLAGRGERDSSAGGLAKLDPGL